MFVGVFVYFSVVSGFVGEVSLWGEGGKEDLCSWVMFLWWSEEEARVFFRFVFR